MRAEDFSKDSWKNNVKEAEKPVYDIFYLEGLIKDLKLDEIDRKATNYFIKDLKNKCVEYFRILSNASQQREEIKVDERAVYELNRRFKHEALIDDINKIIEIIGRYDKKSADVFGNFLSDRRKIGEWAFKAGEILR